MGYVHDTQMRQLIHPFQAIGFTAAWALAAGAVSNSLVYGCDATDESAALWFPVMLPSNAAAQKGAYLVSIDVYYEILNAACDAVDAVIYKNVLPADTAAVTVSAPAFSYDTGHDTAAERDDLDQHTMTLTLDTPAWVDEDDFYMVKVTFDKAATSTVEFLGARANFTLRI